MDFSELKIKGQQNKDPCRVTHLAPGLEGNFVNAEETIYESMTITYLPLMGMEELQCVCVCVCLQILDWLLFIQT